MHRITIKLSLIVIATISLLRADILEVPTELFPTIQAAIDSAVNGDTVLVQAGTYNESIHIYGKNIVIGSLFLTTGETSHISSTIIDGTGTIVRFSNVDSTAALTGFSITGGHGEYGGGIGCVTSSPTISYNIIRNNTVGRWGGGILVEYGSSPTIIYNQIINNTAELGSAEEFGGGICIRDSDPLIAHNIISNNSAEIDGGGLYFYNSLLRLLNNVISNNSARSGGGISCDENSSGIIRGNTIFADSADWYGGGIYITGNSNIEIRNNVIHSNWCPWAGGIYINAPHQTIINNTFCYNEGPVSAGALFYFIADTIYNNIFYGNIGQTVTNLSPDTYVENCDFYGNSGDIFNLDPPAGTGVLTTVNSNGDSCDVYSNIFMDPLFADTLNRDFHLTENSPCIDAGDPNSPLDPDNTIADVGAYYFNQSASQNLILNPGCEDALVNGEIPHWTEISGSNWTQRTAGPDPYEGLAYFFPGVAALAELQQDVDVSSYKSTIDAGSQSFIFEGYVRAWPQTPPDQSRIVLEFLDTLKTTKIDSIDSGNYSNTTEWIQIIDTSVAPLGTRYIRIRLISTRRAGTNNDGYYDALSLVAANITGMKEVKQNLPESPILFQNYPNPFNPVTIIRFDLPKSEDVQLIVYDVLGRKVSTLLNKKMHAGRYEVAWNAIGYTSGVYFYQLTSNKFNKVRKMLLIK